MNKSDHQGAEASPRSEATYHEGQGLAASMICNNTSEDVARGQTQTSSLGAARPLPPSADIGPGGQSVGQAAQFYLGNGWGLPAFSLRPRHKIREIENLGIRNRLRHLRH